MTRAVPATIRVAVALWATLQVCCDSNPVQTNTGPGTETIGLVARIAYPSGKPAQGAQVFVRTPDYLADTSTTAPANEPDAVVDSAGYFRVNGLVRDDYRIEIRDTLSSAVVVAYDTRATEDSLVDIGDQVLVPAGTLHGRMTGAGATNYVRIRGLERVLRLSASEGDSMAYRMQHLPAGYLSIHFLSLWPDTALGTETRIELVSGQEDSLEYTILGTGASALYYGTLRAATAHFLSPAAWTGSIVIQHAEAHVLSWDIFGSGTVQVDTVTSHTLDMRDSSSAIITIGPTTAASVRWRSSGSSVVTLGPVRASRSVLHFNGASQFDTERIEGDSIYIFDGGTGKLRLDSCVVRAACIEQTRSSQCTMTGRAERMTMSIVGSGICDAFAFTCDSAWVELSGFGEARVYAGTYLETNNTGSGTIYYLGTPRVVNNGTGLVAPWTAGGLGMVAPPW